MHAQSAPDPDAVIKDVGLEQKLDAQLPLGLMFRDEEGRSVPLRQYFGEKPVLLMLLQFRCTMLCTEELNVLVDSLKQLKFTPGREFTLLVVSIDPREGPAEASAEKAKVLAQYGRPGAEQGWHFLTGPDASIKPLAQALGFRYRYDPRTDQYAHPDGVIIATPAGRASRYFFRLEYPPNFLRLGLIESASNRIGTPLDAIALLCYHYNPVTGTYGPSLMKLTRAMGVLTVLLLAIGVIILRRRERTVNLSPLGLDQDPASPGPQSPVSPSGKPEIGAPAEVGHPKSKIQNPAAEGEL